MKHFFTFLVVLSFTGSLCAQSVNDYKYVIVPEKYEFLKTNDQYQVNSLTKFLFSKYGFDSYLQNEDKPFSTRVKGCEVLHADVESESNFIQAKLVVVLKDCKGAVVYKTSQGSSKEKDFKRAYHEALREAFLDIEELRYRYNGHSIPEVGVQEEQKVMVQKTTPQPQPKTMAEAIAFKNENLIETTGNAQVIVTKVTAERIEIDTIYMSEDGFYKAIKEGDILTFKEGSKTIGIANIDLKEAFEVKTSEFSGMAFFLEGRVVIKRKIKGVSGVVEMIFIKE